MRCVRALVALALFASTACLAAEPPAEPPAGPPETPGEPAQGGQDDAPAVRLAPGDLVEYRFGQWTRERAGSGETRVHQERLTQGTATVLALEATEGGGLRVALLSDLQDELQSVSPERKPLRRRWRGAVVLRLDARLRPAAVGEAASGLAVGDGYLAALPENAPEPPPEVPLFFPPVALGRLAATGQWEEEISPLVPFSGPPAGRGRVGAEPLKERPGFVRLTRELPGEKVNYTERFLLEPGARRLAACEFVYHACGGAGNARQVTVFEETGRRALEAEALAAAREAAAAVEKAAPLLVPRPEEAARVLEALREKQPGSPFVPAIDAALGGLRAGRRE